MSTIFTNQFSQLLFGNIITPYTVVALDDIEVVIVGVRNHFARSVRKWHRVLLELRPEVWNLEDAKTKVSKNRKWQKGGINSRNYQ